MNLRNTYKLAFIGGPDVYLRIELMHVLKDEFDTFAIGSDPEASDRFTEAGFRYYRYKLTRRVNPLADLLTVAQLFRIFRQERPDVVHAFDTKPCVLARIAARLAGVPVVVGTLPGLGSLYVENGARMTRAVRPIYEALQGLASRISDLTILQNHSDARLLTSRGILPAAKAKVLPGSGVNTSFFDLNMYTQPELHRVRSDLGIHADSMIVTMVSRLIGSKGAVEFALTAKAVHRSQPEIHFLLVGPNDGESQDRLSEAQLSEIRKRVTWLGPRHDIRSILAVSNIVVLPSFYPEGIPRVLLEAASMGLPIITTDLPGCNDVVEHGINGLLVPARDHTSLTEAVLHLATKPEVRRRFGLQSRQRAVERFDVAIVSNRLSSIYRGLLENRGAPVPESE